MAVAAAAPPLEGVVEVEADEEAGEEWPRLRLWRGILKRRGCGPPKHVVRTCACSSCHKIAVRAPVEKDTRGKEKKGTFQEDIKQQTISLRLF